MCKRTKYYVCGVIVVQNKIFLMRLIAEDLKKVPFSFPGLKVNKNQEDDIEKLKLAIKYKYQGEIEVDTYIGEQQIIENKQKTILRAYYCHLTHNLFLDRELIDYRFPSIEQLPKYNYHPLDLLVAKRFFLFHQVYEGELCLEGRSEKEFDEINLYLDALIYFQKKIPLKLIQDYNDLMRSSAPIEQLRKAMRFILDTYHLDYHEFLETLEKKRPKRKKNRW